MGYSVELKNITFKPPRTKQKGVLNNISFKVNESEFVTLIGRNGHGKTSIIKAISGELEQSYVQGSVIVGNNEINELIHKRAHGVGIVHQYVQDDLIQSLSISKNIQIRQLFSNDRSTRKEAAPNKDWEGKINAKLSQFLTTKDFSPTIDTIVDKLSGGQIQLLNVLIAAEFEHSSKNGCQLLLLDEHLTSLDVIVKAKVMELIKKITDSNGCNTTIIMVTHDLEYALEYSHKILVIYEGTVKTSIQKSDTERWNKIFLKEQLI